MEEENKLLKETVEQLKLELDKMKKDIEAQISHQKMGTSEKGKSKWHSQGGFDALCWLVVQNEDLFGTNLVKKVREHFKYSL